MKRKLYDLKEIVTETGLPERTVRYYLSKVIEAPSGTPGRKSYYDQLTVDQLMLAQQILTQDYDPEKGEVKPTLREFRDWLDGLDEAEVRRLVEMPYRVKPKALIQGRTVQRSSKGFDREQTYKAAPPRDKTGKPDPVMHSLSPDFLPDSMDDASLFDAEAEAPAGHPEHPETPQTPKPEDKTANTTSQSNDQAGRRDSATDYLDRVMGSPGAPRRDRRRDAPRSAGSDASQEPWQRHRFGDTLEIHTRQPLTREQARQVRLAGELLKTILKSN